MTEHTPEQPNYHTYESNPVPWWIAVMWAIYFLFGVSYLLVNLLAQ